MACAGAPGFVIFLSDTCSKWLRKLKLRPMILSNRQRIIEMFDSCPRNQVRKLDKDMCVWYSVIAGRRAVTVPPGIGGCAFEASSWKPPAVPLDECTRGLKGGVMKQEFTCE